MGMGTSTFVIRWINFLTMLLAVFVMGFGVWMSTHHEACRRTLTLPVIGLGGVIFVISVIGFLGALKRSAKYLIMLAIILIGILAFTVMAFIVTNNGSGHSVPGLRASKKMNEESKNIEESNRDISKSEGGFKSE